MSEKEKNEAVEVTIEHDDDNSDRIYTVVRTVIADDGDDDEDDE